MVSDTDVEPGHENCFVDINNSDCLDTTVANVYFLSKSVFWTYTPALHMVI